jgi:hypothetical protein
MTTMNPDMLIALGGVRVVTDATRAAEARRLIARLRAGEFEDEAEHSGEWMAGHTPGKVGELDEAEVHGLMSHAKKAGVMVIVLFFLVFPLASCVITALGGEPGY